MSSPTPLLPPELECAIFTLAAELDPPLCTVLILVARRVFVWIEPLLYQRIDFTSESASQALINAAKEKPTLLESGVRRLVIRLKPSIDTTELITVALPACRNLTHLCIKHSSDPLPGPDSDYPGLLGTLQHLPIRRLALSINRLLNGPPASPPLDAAAALPHLTHLRISHASPGLLVASTHARTFIAALPSLTHLAIHPTGASRPPSINDWVEQDLPNLRLVLLLRSPVSNFGFPTDVRDPRIVRVTLRAAEGDEARAGRRNLNHWERGEEIVEKRLRLGAASASQWQSTASLSGQLSDLRMELTPNEV
ncbi:hypothetical protein HMN09_00575300 [Mycena chlorophos]|uniref:Uncharacterized protein n=1 Tax=Mycena chlorophos TaxID=658473 RepID=A0A8H6TAY6_MYCCL|nr:hypothetical protein HMN09_00575300 [Mycena chlorophos]